jgi:hypothetical protein
VLDVGFALHSGKCLIFDIFFSILANIREGGGKPPTNTPKMSLQSSRKPLKKKKKKKKWKLSKQLA